MSFLSNREVFIFTCEGTSSRQGPRFIPESAGGYRGGAVCGWRERPRIPEWGGGWIKIGFVRLGNARNNVDAGARACDVAPAKQDVASRTLAVTVNLGRRSRVIAQDGRS